MMQIDASDIHLYPFSEFLNLDGKGWRWTEYA